jgi:predicted RNA-binding Zn ribbon-like protein
VQQFVNTADQEHEREWWPSPAALSAWLEEHELSGTGCGEAELWRALELREALRALLRLNNAGGVANDAVAAVNRAAEGAGVALALDGRARVVVTSRGKGIDAAFGRILVCVFEAMLGGTWPRLKACRNCDWAYYDYSRNRAATWCSMSICGNRLKTRAYRRRRKG